MIASSQPGAIFYDHAMKVCKGLDFVPLAPISLDARGTFDDPSSAGVEDEHALVEPLLRKAAELGHPDAQFCLGALYASGVFVDYDDLEALRWYNRAADQGHPQAAFQIVKYLRLDPAEARKTHAPPLPDAEVERLLGIALTKGGEIETHFDKEAHYQLGSFLHASRSRFERLHLWSYSGFGRLRTAARQGHIPAIDEVASILGDAGKDQEAAEWWKTLGQIRYLEGNVEEAAYLCMKAQQARLLGDRSGDDEEDPKLLIIGGPFNDVEWAIVLPPLGGADAAYKLALLSAESEEPEVESTKGWFRIAAELGHREASEALEWYRAAEDAGHPQVRGAHSEALFSLGKSRWDDWLSDENDDLDVASEALEWYRAADEAGHPQARATRLEALYSLGEYYSGGEEPSNLDEARRWYGMAAEEGLAEAQFQLGILGVAPEYDPAVGALWCVRAAEQGHQKAQWHLGYLYLKGIAVPQDYEQAARWYRAAAEQGEKDAQNNLGCLYEHGTGVPKDYVQAARWYRAAAVQGESSAQYNLGRLYEDGAGVPQNHEKAAGWYRAAAEKGEKAAQYNLGRLYDNGTGVPQDFIQAARWYGAAAAQGEKIGQYNLGLLYADGSGVPQNYEKAAGWYRAAAEQGEKDAQNNLGCLYENGTGVPQDYEKAAGWYRAAAEQGHLLAQYNLGLLYANGSGVPQDYEKAAGWYRAAADQGEKDAQYNLGCLYTNGTGVPKDLSLALAWFQKAAEQGHQQAQFQLGYCYSQGIWVHQDFEKAVRWYRAAAEQGDTHAQHNLGCLYTNGTGVPKDLSLALAWFQKAAERGDSNAAHHVGLAKLHGRGTGVNKDEALIWLRKAAESGHELARAHVEELTRIPPTPHPVTRPTTVAEGGGNTPVMGTATRNIPRYVVLDFETTGLSPGKGDRVIEVGAVEIVDGRIGRHYESLANPGFPISARITEITTITNAMLRTAPSLEHVMRELAAFIDGATLVAHNAAFDRKFLQAELERLNLWKKPEFLCTLQLGRRCYPGLANYKLKNLADHLGVALPDTFHRALADAMTTAHIFVRVYTPSRPAVADLFPARALQPEPRQTPAPHPAPLLPPESPSELRTAPIRQGVPAPPAAAAVLRQQTPSL